MSQGAAINKSKRNTGERPQPLQPGEIAVHYEQCDQRRDDEDRDEQRVDQDAEAERRPE